MTTPMERALKNLGDVANVVGPMPIKSGALQGLCSLLAAEIIANAIKEAAHPAKSEPLTIEIKRMANDAVYYDHIIGKLRDAGLK